MVRLDQSTSETLHTYTSMTDFEEYFDHNTDPANEDSDVSRIIFMAPGLSLFWHCHTFLPHISQITVSIFSIYIKIE